MPILESKTVTSGVLTIQVSIPQDELAPHIERAGVDLQKNRPLRGFRPGKAPLAEARRAYGEMALLEASLHYAVPSALADIIKRENFLTIGEPQIQVTKITPAEPLEFTATTALLPEVKLGNYKSIREKSKAIAVDDQEIDEAIEELRQMRSSQKLVTEPAAKTNRVIVDLKMSKGGVPIEGGQAQNHAIDLFKPYFIPGFTEELIGLKAEDSKKFSLPFPDDHYNPTLRGAIIDFEIALKGVYEFDRPALDDAFAASLGKFTNLADLRNQITTNIKAMKQEEESARLERAIIDELIKQTHFGDIPALLVDSELHQMLAKLKNRIEHDGGVWKDYLEHLKKSENTMKEEMRAEAITRVKAALLMRAIGEVENISVTPEEVAAEQDVALKQYADDHEMQEYIKSADYASHLKHILLTRKVMEKMKEIATQ